MPYLFLVNDKNQKKGYQIL